MKKILLGMMSLLLAMSVMAERVTQEDAAIVANNFMNAAPSASSVKKAPVKRMVLKAVAQQPEEAQYYVYENADGEGWVMVAANDVVRPILAYSNTGSFRTDNMPTNVKGWLKKYDKFISKLEQEGVSAGEETAEEWKAVRKGARRVTQATAVVGPLITTQWDQDEPYNLLCPGTGTWGKSSTKAATGCVATAMAQVMNYWQWPVKGTGSHTYTPKDPNSNSGAQSKRYGQQTANFGATTYDWANMKKKHYTNDTEAQKTAISTLMYHCGVATEMMYGNYADGGSGTYTVNYGDWTDYECAQTAFYAFFGYKKPTGYMRDGYTYGGTKYYDKWTDAAWTNMIKGELDKKHPIMYAGASSEGGHSFVCDGYDSSDYFHFNWGWSGDCDGYFLLSNLNPGGDGIGGGGYDFSEQQDVIIGIEPNVTGHTVVVNGTGCTITPSAQVAENNKQLTATITPTDETYDFTSLTVKLGSTTLTKTTHYTLSADNKTLTIKASAITGDASNNLTITAVWTKNRYKYELLGENCAPEMDEGMLAKNAALNLTITPNSGYTLADASCWDVEMGGVALTYGTGFTYNANTGAFAIAQVTGDVAILAYGGKAVTWLANGEQFARNIALSDKLTLPANEPEACDGKVFVGWTATADYESASVAPTMVKDGDAANATTYYAVFATKGEGATGWTLVTDASTLKAGDVLVMACTSKNATAGDISSQIMASVTSSFSNGTISSLGSGTVELTLGGSKDAWTLTSSNGKLGATAVKKVAWNDGTMTWEISISNNNASIQSTTSSYGRFLYNNSNPRFTTYTSDPTAAMLLPQLYRKGGGASYSDYTTSCTPAEPCTSKVTVSKGTAEHGSFSLDYFGELNTCGGAVTVTVTATPAEGYRFKEITQTGVEGVTIDQAAKTVTYAKKSEGTSIINVVFEEKEKYTVEFIANGASLSTQTLYEGTAADAPNNVEAPCEDYTFAGWWTETLTEDNTEAKSWVNDFIVNKNQTYYAVFSKTVESEGEGESEVASVTFKTNSTDNNNDRTTSANIRTYLVDSETGINSYSGSKLYANTNGLKIGSSNNSGYITLTLNTTAEVAKVIVNASQYGSDTGQIKVEAGSTSLGTQSPASGLVFESDYAIETNKITISTTSKRAYIASISVIAGGGASSTTYYTTTTHCGPTAVEEVNSEWTRDACRKVLHNGQIYLLYQGTMYDVQGRRVKEL